MWANYDLIKLSDVISIVLIYTQTHIREKENHWAQAFTSKLQSFMKFVDKARQGIYLYSLNEMPKITLKYQLMSCCCFFFCCSMSSTMWYSNYVFYIYKDCWCSNNNNVYTMLGFETTHTFKHKIISSCLLEHACEEE